MDLTTRLGLGLFGTGLAGDVIPDEAADISKVNDNFRKIDSLIGWILCTAATHPATTFRGLGILETDTGKAYIHDGSTFLFAFDTNLANGLRGTTTQRDAYWGAPPTGATTPEQTSRVTLANKGPRWFNQDKGYEEQYFAKVGDLGANDAWTALNPGWYPSGNGTVPRASVSYVPNKAVSFGAGTSLITTNTLSSGVAWIQEMDKPIGGVTYGKLDGTSPGLRLTAPIEGIWRINGALNTGFSSFTIFAKRNDVSGDFTNMVASASAGTGGNGVAATEFHKQVHVSANDFFIFALSSPGAGNINVSYEENFQFGIEWVRPRTR